MVQGRVKWFNKNNGIGFIRNLETQEDIFVHHSELATKTDCYRLLVEGEYVEYEEGPASSPHIKQAKKVTGIRGGDLMCEVRRTNEKVANRNSAGGSGSGSGDRVKPGRYLFREPGVSVSPTESIPVNNRFDSLAPEPEN